MAIKTHEVYYPLYENKDKFIYLITGGRGCERPEQEIIMADMTTKQLKDVNVGDKVMGQDGTPRTVLRTIKGHSMMYRVSQKNAEDYYVNDIHKLVLRKSKRACEKIIYKDGKPVGTMEMYKAYPKEIEIPITEYFDMPVTIRNEYYGFKVGVIPYPYQHVEIDPYLLGLWIGDGTAIFPNITNPDEEIKAWLEDYCQKNGQKLNGEFKQGAYHFRIVGDGKIGHNKFLNGLNHYGLIGNKHIPQEYISNSVEVRLNLLAGILDTDGTFNKFSYDVIQKDYGIAKSIKYIADTLGFRTSMHEKSVKGYGIYYRVTIGGDLWRIPCKVERKKAHEQDFHKNKNWLVSSISVEEVGEGDWCGITLDGDHRYLHPDGTVMRNSGKSFGVNTFIERLTFELGETEGRKIAHQILFTRYTMVSANISIIPEFLEKIEMDGTQRYFRKTKTDITNLMTGSTIMFRGINTSSGNQTAKLKSIHGITTFVCDEAEEWQNEREFDTIMLSIRQKGLKNRIIIIMNPTDSNHFIYQRFIKDTHRIVEYDGVPVQISTHPNVCHIHTTYLDNKNHCAEDFLREVEVMKENAPDKYAHIVIGRWADVAEGAIFTKWSIIDEFPDDCEKVACGLDFGYSRDVSACVKCGIKKNDLYIDEQFYKTGMLSGELIRELKKTGCFIYADSADPRLIDEIALGGVIIYPVAKGAGSVIAGIEKMKNFDHIYVTKRSVNVHEELRNYTWDKDKNGNYINQPIDAYNHACFVAGTQIATTDGQVPIESVKVGQSVVNSDGVHKVVRTFDNGVKQVFTYTLRTEEGVVSVRCTPDHKIKTDNGWKRISELQEGDRVYLHKSSMASCTESSTESDTSRMETDICTTMSGNSTMEKLRKVSISTILTLMRTIMKSQTFKRCLQLNMHEFMRSSTRQMKNTARNEGNALTKPESMQVRGMEAKMELSGTRSTANRFIRILSKGSSLVSAAETYLTLRLKGNSAQMLASRKQEDVLVLTTKQECAKYAERSSSQTRTSKEDSVQESARRKGLEKLERMLGSTPRNKSSYVCDAEKDSTQSTLDGTSTAKGARQKQTKSNAHAKYAERSSCLASTTSHDSAVPSVLVSITAKDEGHENVYNIEVEDVHEYFANGLLVSNCDAARYYINGKILGKVMHPKNVTKEQLGIY